MCDLSPCAEACRLQNLLFVCSRRDEHSGGQILGRRADGRRIVPLKRRSVCGLRADRRHTEAIANLLPLTARAAYAASRISSNLKGTTKQFGCLQAPATNPN